MARDGTERDVFQRDGLAWIGIEHLTRAGIERAQRAWLQEQGGFSEAWLARFEQCFALYWARAEELHRRAPRSWLPPRVQIVAIATRPLRPFFQPFQRASWLVYASDFEPALASPELGVYALFQAERLGWLAQIVPGYLANLSYWLLRSEEECARFREDCERTPRPDAGALRAVAAALELVRSCHHRELRARVLVGEPELELAGSGLTYAVSRRHQAEAFLRRLPRELERVVQEHFARFTACAPACLAEFLGWIADEPPRVLVAGEHGAILWDPERARATDALRVALKDCAREVLASLRADLEVASARSQAFLVSLAEGVAAPRPKLAMDQDGLSYLHRERNAIAYPLGGGSSYRLREPAPPYERAMLAARTVHEWGHAAVDQGWVPVPEERRIEHAAVRAELVALLDEIWSAAPAAIRLAGARELQRTPGVGEALVRGVEGRMMDFQVNLLAQRYLEALERETYVRNNVRCLAHEYGAGGLFHLLVRYAYEAQYLRFSAAADALEYLCRSAWLEQQFLQPRVLTPDQLASVFALVGRLCDGYAVDPRSFRPGAFPL